MLDIRKRGSTVLDLIPQSFCEVFQVETIKMATSPSDPFFRASSGLFKEFPNHQSPYFQLPPPHHPTTPALNQRPKISDSLCDLSSLSKCACRQLEPIWHRPYLKKVHLKAFQTAARKTLQSAPHWNKIHPEMMNWFFWNSGEQGWATTNHTLPNLSGWWSTFSPTWGFFYEKNMLLFCTTASKVYEVDLEIQPRSNINCRSRACFKKKTVENTQKSDKKSYHYILSKDRMDLLSSYVKFPKIIVFCLKWFHSSPQIHWLFVAEWHRCFIDICSTP